MKPIVRALNEPNRRQRAYAAALLCAATATSLPAQTFGTLHSFAVTDGQTPQGALVQATDGDLYGTTSGGGANGQGTIFKINSSGTLTTVYSFCSQDGCTDGANPLAGLVQATSGDLYGTTSGGGASGYGTVFRIKLSGKLTPLYSFSCSDGTCPDGANPDVGLVQATNGDFYGTTQDAYGTVFKITPGGTLTTLYSFSYPGRKGFFPAAGLVQTTNGDLYGTTSAGPEENGGGTIFEITAGGALKTLDAFGLYSSCSPYAGLVQAADGELYGTTSGCGTSGYGTVFSVTTTGTLTFLYSFCSLSGCTDGEFPYAGLVQATDGNLYGTTYQGGNNSCEDSFGCGTIFKITSGGALTTQYTFCSQTGCTDGEYPGAALIQGTDGNLYGTTPEGGASGDGTVFRLSVGLGPFVETLPTSGKAGKTVKILGNDLTGATSITFNGTAAAYTVVSKSEIATTVPAGAATGTVVVVTPSQTLSSNVPFKVP